MEAVRVWACIAVCAMKREFSDCFEASLVDLRSLLGWMDICTICALWMLTKHQRIENTFFARNTNIGLLCDLCIVKISDLCTVLIIGGNFEREIVKMTIERTWCIGIGLFGFYFYRKWCLIDWNQVYDEWQLDWIFYESIDFCRLSRQSRE